MPIYAVRARPGRQEDRNSSQVNAILVSAADPAAARLAAIAAAPDGESRPHDAWSVDEVTGTVIVEGNLIFAGERRRGR